MRFQQHQHLELFLFSTLSQPFPLLPPAPRSCRQSPPVLQASPSLTLATHFFFQKLRITAAPPREVCENAQCRSPGVATPGAECEKRALHLMPDWPNLLPDSWFFLFPVAQQEHGQKWCGRRREGTVIVSRSVEISQTPTHPPTYPPSLPPPINCFSVKRKSVPGQQETTSLQNNQKTVCTHIWITFNLSHESPYIEYNTLQCPQLHLFFNMHARKKSLIPKVTFALCSTQEIHAQTHFYLKKLKICYNNISCIWAGYSSVSSRPRPMLHISLCCHATKYARDMQNHVNLIVTTALLMLFKFLLQQLLVISKCWIIEWIKCLFALTTTEKHDIRIFRIAHPLNYIVVGG